MCSHLLSMLYISDRRAGEDEIAACCNIGRASVSTGSARGLSDVGRTQRFLRDSTHVL